MLSDGKGEVRELTRSAPLIKNELRMLRRSFISTAGQGLSPLLVAFRTVDHYVVRAHDGASSEDQQSPFLPDDVAEMLRLSACGWGLSGLRGSSLH